MAKPSVKTGPGFLQYTEGSAGEEQLLAKSGRTATNTSSWLNCGRVGDIVFAVDLGTVTTNLTFEFFGQETTSSTETDKVSYGRIQTSGSDDNKQFALKACIRHPYVRVTVTHSGSTSQTYGVSVQNKYWDESYGKRTASTVS